MEVRHNKTRKAQTKHKNNEKDPPRPHKRG